MADDPTTASATAIADPPERALIPSPADAAPSVAPPKDEKKNKKSKKGKKDEEEDLEYEVEFETPFGKIEFEFEPLSKKQKKDKAQKVRAEQQAKSVALKATALAEKQAAGGTSGGRRGSGLVIALVVFGIVAGAVVLAIWLFARPGDDDAIPPEFLHDEELPEPEPQGFVAKARHRMQSAVRSGRQASREVQDEQQRKFEEMTGR